MSATDERPGRLPGDQILGATLHAELSLRGLSLATAESLTGGSLADLVSASPGASESFLGGLVCYATRVKTEVLGVSADVVERHGVVSAACAEAMAVRVRELLGADWALSTTGVAGPAEQEGKPVGTVYVGVAGPLHSRAHEMHLFGDRSRIRAETVRAAVHALLADLSRSARARPAL